MIKHYTNGEASELESFFQILELAIPKIICYYLTNLGYNI